MDLGNFTVSLSVKNITASKDFYQKLGFTVVFGEEAQNWLILRNGDCKVGLFQGMFAGNMLTFNPGWDTDGKEVPQYTDVRELQKTLKRVGIVPTTEADEASQGPASFIVADPDGNVILFDQHR